MERKHKSAISAKFPDANEEKVFFHQLSTIGDVKKK